MRGRRTRGCRRGEERKRKGKGGEWRRGWGVMGIRGNITEN